VGIPPQMQSQIFEIFAQVEEHLTKAQGGLGIGLALVKQLVALHGGTIDVESAGQGMGSAFSVRIPIAAEPPKARTPDPSTHHASN
jgi:signal transduction histidine kinase